MNRISFHGIVLSVLLLLTTASWATTILNYPDRFVYPTGEERSWDKQGSSSWSLWMVLSSVQTAFTYEKPDTRSTILDTLRFLDPFYVTEVNGNYLHIWKDAENTTGTLSQEAVDCGWALKSRLLQWNRPLVELDHLTPQRVIVGLQEMAFSFENPDGYSSFLCRQAPDLYADPTDYEVTAGQCFYVYQKFLDSRHRRWSLLGTSRLIATQAMRSTIVGWVLDDHLLPFNSYTALRIAEPSPDLVGSQWFAPADTLNGFGWRLFDTPGAIDTPTPKGWILKVSRKKLTNYLRQPKPGMQGDPIYIIVSLRYSYSPELVKDARPEMLLSESELREARLRLAEMAGSHEALVRLVNNAARIRSLSIDTEMTKNYLAGMIGFYIPGLLPDTLTVNGLKNLNADDTASLREKMRIVSENLDPGRGYPSVPGYNDEPLYWVDVRNLFSEQ
jgi:hypothetical protein